MTSPYYVLAAEPLGVNRVRAFYNDDSDSPCRILDRPKVFRHAGFDVSTGDLARMVDDHWEVRNGDRKLLQLFEDGSVIFRVRADWEFLGWAGQSTSVSDWINPVATVEMHTSFVHLYREVLTRLKNTDVAVHFTLSFRQPKGAERRFQLTPYYDGRIREVFDPKIFRLHSFDARESLEMHSGLIASRPNRVAFQILSKFYDMFDAPATEIPFFGSRNGEEEIDIARLTSLQ